MNSIKLVSDASYLCSIKMQSMRTMMVNGGHPSPASRPVHRGLSQCHSKPFDSVILALIYATLHDP
jgi:hypothetical protein